MPNLVIARADGDEPAVLALTGDEVSCGRSQFNSLVFPDTAVSRVHCIIEPLQDGAYRLVDLGSRNGTYLNGRPVASTVLDDYDQITIGGNRIVYVDGDADPVEVLSRARRLPCPWMALAPTPSGSSDPSGLESTSRSTRKHALPICSAEDTSGRIQESLLRISLLSQVVASETDLRLLLDLVLDAMLEVTGLERAVLILCDHAGGYLHPTSGRARGGTPLPADDWTYPRDRLDAALESGELEVFAADSGELLHSVTIPLQTPTAWRSPERRRVAPRRRHLGVCYLTGFEPPGSMDDEVAWALQAFAGQMASAIHRTTLREQATTDVLTGLYNRLFVRQILEDELARGEQFGVALIDLDHFKQVNDTHGHLVGDEVLRRVAQRIHRVVRSDDVVGRWGGEEFLVILPGIEHSGAWAVGDKIAEAISSRPIGEERVEITASIGIANAPRDGHTADELMLHADIALYAAKNLGRDQVCVYSPGLEKIRAGWSPGRSSMEAMFGSLT